MRELLVEYRADPWMHEKQVRHPSQVFCRLEFYISQRGRRSMICVVVRHWIWTRGANEFCEAKTMPGSRSRLATREGD